MISSSVDNPDMYSSSLSIPAVLVVVVWGVGGAAAAVVRAECLSGGAADGTERGAAAGSVGDLVWATEAALVFLVAGWSSGTVVASAAFRFLVRGGMVAVFWVGERLYRIGGRVARRVGGLGWWAMGRAG